MEPFKGLKASMLEYNPSQIGFAPAQVPSATYCEYAKSSLIDLN